MSEEYRWITTDRKGECEACSTQIQPGERVLWSLTDKRKVWCKRCGSVNSTDTEEGKGIDNCAGASTVNGASVGANDERARATFIRPGGKWVLRYSNANVLLCVWEEEV